MCNFEFEDETSDGICNRHIFTYEYVNIRNTFIDLVKSNAFEQIFDDINKLYLKVIVEYYCDLLSELEKAFREKSTISVKPTEFDS